jgi:hypothetical protein
MKPIEAREEKKIIWVVIMKVMPFSHYIDAQLTIFSHCYKRQNGIQKHRPRCHQQISQCVTKLI